MQEFSQITNLNQLRGKKLSLGEKPTEKQNGPQFDTETCAKHLLKTINLECGKDIACENNDFPDQVIKLKKKKIDVFFILAKPPAQTVSLLSDKLVLIPVEPEVVHEMNKQTRNYYFPGFIPLGDYIPGHEKEYIPAVFVADLVLSHKESPKQIRNNVAKVFGELAGKQSEMQKFAPKTIINFTEYPEPVQPGKERDPELPWLPKGPYPFIPSWPQKEVPYTGEELMYIVNDYSLSRKYQESTVYVSTLNRRGLMIEKIFYSLGTNYLVNYNKFLTWEIRKITFPFRLFKGFSTVNIPQDEKGLAQLNVIDLDSQGRIIEGNWIFDPALRRVRRISGWRDAFLYISPISTDDYIGRRPWDENHLIIREDKICDIFYGYKKFL